MGRRGLPQLQAPPFPIYPTIRFLDRPKPTPGNEIEYYYMQELQTELIDRSLPFATHHIDTLCKDKAYKTKTRNQFYEHRLI